MSDNQKDSFIRRYKDELIHKNKNNPFLVDRDDCIEFKNKIYHEYFLAFYIAQVPAESSNILANYNTTSVFLGIFLIHLLNYDTTQLDALNFYHLCNIFAVYGVEYDRPLEMTWNGVEWTEHVLNPSLKIPLFTFGNRTLRLRIPRDGSLQNISVIAPEEQREGTQVIIEYPFDNYEDILGLSNVDIVANDISILAHRTSIDRTYIDCENLNANMMYQIIRKGDDNIIFASNINVHERFDRSIIQRRIANIYTFDISEFRTQISRIFSWFRKRGRSSFGIYDKRFKTIIENRGRFGLITSFLFNESLITRGDHAIIMQSDIIDRFGIHYIKFNEISFDGAGFDELYRRFEQYREAQNL